MESSVFNDGMSDTITHVAPAQTLSGPPAVQAPQVWRAAIDGVRCDLHSLSRGDAVALALPRLRDTNRNDGYTTP